MAMCLDLDFDPLSAQITVGNEAMPLKMVVNGEHVFTDQMDSPRPLEILIQEFMAASRKRGPDIQGLKLGVRVVGYLEAMEKQRRGNKWRSVAR